MMKNDIKYEEYYVTYMDILGFKDIVDNPNISCEEIYSILADSGKNILQDISKNNETVLKTSDIGIYVMSDSIVYYIKASVENALPILISNCAVLMGMLSVRDNIILIRGAITKGQLLAKDNIIFGPALSNAYRLENECATYPRIIIDGSLKTELYDCLTPSSLLPQKVYIKRILEQIIYVNDDEWACVKNAIFFIDKLKDYLDRYIYMITEEMNKTHDERIREKYLYLVKLSKALKNNPTCRFVEGFSDKTI